jgi:hypothetical protein
MSRDLHPIDQSFRDAFEHFEATPPELVWDNIASEIKPQKKRRALIFWLLPVGTLLVGLSYYNWNLVSENKNLQAKNQNLEQVLAEKNNVSTVTAAITSNISSNIASNLISTSNQKNHNTTGNFTRQNTDNLSFNTRKQEIINAFSSREKIDEKKL